MLNKSEIDSHIEALGNGLFGKIKYDFRFSYEPFKFFKAKFHKEENIKKLINYNLYKKIR